MIKIRNIYGDLFRYLEYYFIFLELDRDRVKDILFFFCLFYYSFDLIYYEGNDLFDFI